MNKPLICCNIQIKCNFSKIYYLFVIKNKHDAIKLLQAGETFSSPPGIIICELHKHLDLHESTVSEPASQGSTVISKTLSKKSNINTQCYGYTLLSMLHLMWKKCFINDK